MAFRLSKTIRILPGIQMSVSPRGIGYSGGAGGLRMSRSPGGRITSSLGLGGSSLSHAGTGRLTQSLLGAIGGPRQAAPPPSGWPAASPPTQAPSGWPAAPPPAPAQSGWPDASSQPAPPSSGWPGATPAAGQPGSLAQGPPLPADEQELYQIAVDEQHQLDPALLAGHLPPFARSHPHLRALCAAMDGAAQFAAGNAARARELLAWAVASGEDFGAHPFVQTRLLGSPSALSGVTVPIASGVTVTLPFGRDVLALALAELHQSAGDLDAAIDVVEGVDPTTPAAVSLAELYSESGRHSDVIDVTDGLSNVDDASALLLVFRGVAYRELGQRDAALATLREALRRPGCNPAIRHRALIERATMSAARGDAASARQDLEVVRAEDPSYPGVAEALARLPSS